MQPIKKRSVAGLLATFDAYLHEVRGLREGTRRIYTGYVKQFLNAHASDGVVDLEALTGADVIDFVSGAAKYYDGSRTLGHVVTALRSFFRYARVVGLRSDRLDYAVPSVQKRPSPLPSRLNEQQLAQLFEVLSSWNTPRGLRDGAIIVCIARLGLRSSEVVKLELEDISWRDGTLRVPTRKTGHAALLPLPVDVGEALTRYLRHGRPPTSSRRVFVLTQDRIGAPISESIIGRAVQEALRKAGFETVTGGANLLRHSFATNLLANGVSLTQIGDVMGHRSLTTTGIYARVDITALAEVGLAWPGA